MTIYHNPRCKKSRETLQILKEHGIEPEIREYLKDTPSPEELKAVVQKLDGGLDELIRKEEKRFKEEFKGKEFSEEEWLKVLHENPKLIQRPVVITEQKAVIGRPPETVKQLF